MFKLDSKFGLRNWSQIRVQNWSKIGLRNWGPNGSEIGVQTGSEIRPQIGPRNLSFMKFYLPKSLDPQIGATIFFVDITRYQILILATYKLFVIFFEQKKITTTNSNIFFYNFIINPNTYI